MMVTDRVVVSAIEPEDIPTIVRWRNNPEIYAGFIEYEPLNTVAQRMFLERLTQDKTRRLWLISARDSSQRPPYEKTNRPAPDAIPIGTIGLIDIDLRNRRCELGPFFIGDRAFRRFDIAAETELLVLGHCFDHLGLHKVYAYVADSNRRVTRLHISLGFKKEALLREHIFSGGSFRDLHVLSMLQEEYTHRYPSRASPIPHT
jgi:RimJ/RimL family protein N-acetyltransferase